MALSKISGHKKTRSTHLRMRIHGATLTSGKQFCFFAFFLCIISRALVFAAEYEKSICNNVYASISTANYNNGRTSDSINTCVLLVDHV